MRQMVNTVGKIKDDVGEIKCECSALCIGSVVETEASAQGTRSNRTFKNGFPRRTRP